MGNKSLKTNYKYDEEFQCIVKSVNDKEESRMQVDKEDISKLHSVLDKLKEKDMSEQKSKQSELDQMVKEYETKVAVLEQSLVEFALKHELHLSLGDYGSGRTLITKPDHWSGREVGEWLPSSETC